VSGDVRFGVAIPAYRNIESLRHCLRSVEHVAPRLTERLVVTDDSGNGVVRQALQSEFAHVAWIVHPSNFGFGRSANDAVQACAADIAILLNDDVELLTDPVPYLEVAFSQADLFAVTFRSLHDNGTFREGAKRLVWPMGMPRVLHNPADQATPHDGAQPSAYAVGGHAAFDRSKFLELGGFDSLFDPFYWEDVDLGARAAKRGWNTVYLPECVVKHAGPSAIRSQHDEQSIQAITARNRLLFAWRHLPSHLRIAHLASLGFRLAASAVTSNRIFLHAYRAARQRLRTFGRSLPQPLPDSPIKGANRGQN
jgi:GT2 family glycosyltransferase